MTSPFQTKGEVAEWRLVYDLVKHGDFGNVFTYEQIEAVLGRDLSSSRSPIYRAIQELERNHSKTMAVIPTEGYRIVEAREHESLSRGRHRRAHRQLRKGLATVHSTDRSKLTPEERERIDRMELTLGRHEEMLRRLDRKIEKHEQALVDARAQQESALSQTDELSDRVRALEESLSRYKS